MHEAADQIVGLYQRHAAAWVQSRGDGRLEQPWINRFLAQLAPRPTVLDLGCGSGMPMALVLARQGCTVTGVDTAPALVEQARGALPQATWLVADMRGLDLGARFQGILAWNSTFHLTPDDQRAMFAVFARHAAPGSVLMFTAGPRAGVRIGEFAGEPLYHASLDPDETQALLATHGFDVLDHVVEDPNCGDHTVWLAKRRSEALDGDH